MPNHENETGKPLSRKQLVGASLGALGFFAYLALATIFASHPTMHLMLVGPYGISAGLWFFATILTLSWITRRQNRRSRHQ